jgi:3-hydroxyacyl-[acyl-carrier-protein] dehydratase
MNEFAEVARNYRSKAVWSSGAATRALELTQPELERLLPHRPPFLLVDRLLSVDLAQKSVLAEQDLQPDSRWFQGHFPGEPIYPGVLQLELIAQTALTFLALQRTHERGLADGEYSAVSARALKVHYAEFIREVTPRARLQARVRELDDAGFTRTFLGQLSSDGVTRSIAVLEVYLVD